jgi:maltose O-acetyltransferase
MDNTSNPAQTERSKMLRGELYLAMDPGLVAARVRARRLFARYNASDPADNTGRAALLRELLGMRALMPRSSRLFIVITVRRSRLAGVFVNFGAVFLDPARITIGEQAQLGPYVQLLTADHPRDDDTRAAGPESAQPINNGQ